MPKNGFAGRALAALLLAALAVAGARAGERVMTTPQEQARLSAVGRLNVTGQGFCTATLVASDLVLTAAHCLVNRRTGRTVKPGNVHFLPGFRIGAYEAHGVGMRVAVAAVFDPDHADVGRDLGLVRLARPVPPSVVPVALGVRAQDDAPLTLMSYAMDRAQILSVQRGCRVRARLAAVLYTDCEGLPGVSGSPLMQRIEGRAVLVAVASAIRARRKAPVATGQVLAVEVTRARIARLRGALDAPARPRPAPVPRPPLK